MDQPWRADLPILGEDLPAGQTVFYGYCIGTVRVACTESEIELR